MLPDDDAASSTEPLGIVRFAGAFLVGTAAVGGVTGTDLGLSSIFDAGCLWKASWRGYGTLLVGCVAGLLVGCVAWCALLRAENTVLLVLADSSLVSRYSWLRC